METGQNAWGVDSKRGMGGGGKKERSPDSSPTRPSDDRNIDRIALPSHPLLSYWPVKHISLIWPRWYNLAMTTANYLDQFLEPLTEAFTPETARMFANLRANAQLQARVDHLARKVADGTITPGEEAEYKAIIDAADLISILRLKARRFLKESQASNG